MIGLPNTSIIPSALIAADTEEELDAQSIEARLEALEDDLLGDEREVQEIANHLASSASLDVITRVMKRSSVSDAVERTKSSDSTGGSSPDMPIRSRQNTSLNLIVRTQSELDLSVDLEISEELTTETSTPAASVSDTQSSTAAATAAAGAGGSSSAVAGAQKESDNRTAAGSTEESSATKSTPTDAPKSVAPSRTPSRVRKVIPQAIDMDVLLTILQLDPEYKSPAAPEVRSISERHLRDIYDQLEQLLADQPLAAVPATPTYEQVDLVDEYGRKYSELTQRDFDTLKRSSMFIEKDALLELAKMRSSRFSRDVSLDTDEDQITELLMRIANVDSSKLNAARRGSSAQPLLKVRSVFQDRMIDPKGDRLEEFAGFALKKGSGQSKFGRKNWKRRYFVLAQHSFDYYTKDGGDWKGGCSRMKLGRAVVVPDKYVFYDRFDSSFAHRFSVSL